MKVVHMDQRAIEELEEASPKVFRIRHLILLPPLCIVAILLDLLLSLERVALSIGENFHGLTVFPLLTVVEIDSTDCPFGFKDQIAFHLLAGEAKDRIVDVRVHLVVLELLPVLIGEEVYYVPH